MAFDVYQSMNCLFSLISDSIKIAIDFCNSRDLTSDWDFVFSKYFKKKLALSIIWSLVGNSKNDARLEMSRFLNQSFDIEFPASMNDRALTEYDADISSGEWVLMQEKVPFIDIDPHLSLSNFVIPTGDTLSHESLMKTWLSKEQPFILCGPPGSGKVF